MTEYIAGEDIKAWSSIGIGVDGLAYGTDAIFDHLPLMASPGVCWRNIRKGEPVSLIARGMIIIVETPEEIADYERVTDGNDNPA